MRKICPCCNPCSNADEFVKLEFANGRAVAICADCYEAVPKIMRSRPDLNASLLNPFIPVPNDALMRFVEDLDWAIQEEMLARRCHDNDAKKAVAKYLDRRIKAVEEMLRNE